MDVNGLRKWFQKNNVDTNTGRVVVSVTLRSRKYEVSIMQISCSFQQLVIGTSS